MSEVESSSGLRPMRDDKRLASTRKTLGGRGTGGVGGFVGGQIGADSAAPEAAATDALAKSMALFAETAEKMKPFVERATDPKDQKWRESLLQGKLFEFIEAAKFNRNAARAGKTVQASVTAAEGNPTGAVDIALKEGSRTAREVQAKAYSKPEDLATQATKEKYDGMDVLVPKDKVEATNQKLAEKGESKEVVGELRSDGLASGGTSSRELKFAKDNLKLYRIAVEARQVGREAAVSGAHAAVGAAVIGGALSACSNVGSYLAGQTDGRTAVRNFATDSAKSGLRGGSTGALGAVIRQAGIRTGMQTLAKSNVASAVAAGVIEVGATVYEFAKGEITAEEAAGRIGETGSAAASGIYVGAAAGAIFGPGGAVVGSVVGYMAMSWVYQSSLAILQRARLAEEEASRVMAVCAEATRAMDRQREVFERQLETWLTSRADAFQACFQSIDDALVKDEVDDTVEALVRLAGMTGNALRFKDFDEFDQFMTRSTDPLVI